MKFGFPVYTASGIGASAKLAHKLGFDYIELDLNPPRPECITDREIKILENLREEYSLGLAIHAPIFGIDIAHLSEKISEASLSVVLDAMKFSERFNPLYFNFHINSYSNPYLLELKAMKNKIYEKALANAERIVSKAKIPLTLENNGNNLIFKTPEEFSAFGSLGLNFCLDVGHATKSKFNLEKSGVKVGWDVKSWIESFEKNILTVHLHDCVIGGNEISDHCLIGSGIIKFDEVFHALKRTECKYALIEVSEAAEGKLKEKEIKGNLEFCRSGLG